MLRAEPLVCITSRILSAIAHMLMAIAVKFALQGRCSRQLVHFVEAEDLELWTHAKIFFFELTDRV